jgi:hypothetical protein
MQTVFDGTLAPYGFEPFTLLGLIPLGICLYERFVRKRPWSYMFLFIAFVALVGINGILNWDIWRIRQMVASGAMSGGGVQVTRGAVTQHWSITERVRDFQREGLHYKTIISEGFDVGTERFAWKRGESYSPATFSNMIVPRLALADGQLTEVTWFTDTASNNERRIIGLKVGATQ